MQQRINIDLITIILFCLPWQSVAYTTTMKKNACCLLETKEIINISYLGFVRPVSWMLPLSHQTSLRVWRSTDSRMVTEIHHLSFIIDCTYFRPLAHSVVLFSFIQHARMASTSRFARSTLPCDWEWRGFPWTIRPAAGPKLRTNLVIILFTNSLGQQVAAELVEILCTISLPPWPDAKCSSFVHLFSPGLSNCCKRRTIALCSCSLRWVDDNPLAASFSAILLLKSVRWSPILTDADSTLNQPTAQQQQRTLIWYDPKWILMLLHCISFLPSNLPAFAGIYRDLPGFSGIYRL